MYVLAFTLLHSEDLHGVRSGDPGVHCSDIQNVSEQSYMVGEIFLCPGRVALTEKAMLQTYFWQECKHFSKCFMAVVTSP
jgi:hypothetical protein